MHDVFISYSRNDLAWLDEELMPALEAIGASYFRDDAEWQKFRGGGADGKGSGLMPGQNIADALEAALRASRVVLLVQSPDYFASDWCRHELALAEQLAAERAQTGGDFKLLYFLLAGERLDPTKAGRQVLYTDLRNVRERADNLAFALQEVARKEGLRLSLGRRSLQDLLTEPTVRAKIQALRDLHAAFRDAHTKMQAYKETHDAIQCAQDAWQALAAARDELAAQKRVFTQTMTDDLSEQCGHIRSCITAKVIAGERFAWSGQLDRAAAAAAELVKNAKNLELMNKTLESTYSFLFLSTAPIDLNNRIRNAFEKLPVESLRKAIEPLKALRENRWMPEPLAKLTELVTAFDELARLLAEIDDLVAVHDVLQQIDSVFSTALRVESTLSDIENIWPDIEAERQRFDPRVLAARESLQGLERAAEAVKEYLNQETKPDAPPTDEIMYFRRTLNQSFVRADTDLRTDTDLLNTQHQTIDTLLDRLATLASSPPS
jgi:hypothetical protein